MNEVRPTQWDGEALFRLSPHPALLVRAEDGELVLREVNDVAMRLNPDLRRLFGRSFSHLYRDQTAFERSARDALEGRCRVSFEAELHRYDKSASDRRMLVHFRYMPPDQLLITWEDRSPQEMMERALVQSEQRYRAVVSSLPAGVVTQALDGRVLAMNPAAEGMLGFAGGEGLGVDDLPARVELVDEDEAPLPRGSWPDARTDGGERLVGVRREGKVRWLLVASRQITPLDGAPVEILTTLLDTTERTLADRARARSDELYRRIVEATSEGILTSRLDGQLRFVNGRLAAMLGYEVSELEGRTLYDIVDPSLHVRLRENLRRRAAGESGSADMIYRRKDGSPIPLSVVAGPIHEKGEVVGALAMLRDNSELRRASEDLRVSEERLRVALTAGRMGTWEWNATTNLGWWSDNLAEIFDSRAHDGLENFLETVHPDDRAGLTELAVSIVNDPPGGWFEKDYRTKSPDGAPRWARLTGRRIEDGGGVRFAGTLQDVSEHKRLQAQLAAAHQLESVGRLAGGVAHDFNNLLTAIFAAVHGLEAAGQPDQHEDIRTIQLAAEGARDLTRQLLAFARKQLVELRVLELNAILAGVRRILGRLVPEHITLSIELGADLPAVRADAGQVQQVIVNLVLNACESMPGGGRAWLRTRQVQGPDPLRPELGAGRFVILSVEDEGSGIDEEMRPHLFEPFYTTKGTGNGLGLASSYGIVKQLGGEILVRPGSVVGSVFEVCLPAVDGLPSQPRAAAPSATVGRGVVLLVEDDPLVRRATQRMLGRLGYDVVVTSDGEEALEIARDVSRRIDVLLTDVVMPHMGGPELAERLGAVRPGLGILFVSGYTEREVDALRSQGAAFLQKPFSVSALSTTLQELMKPGGDGAAS